MAIFDNKYLVMRIIDALLRNKDITTAIDLLKANRMICNLKDSKIIIDDTFSNIIKDDIGRIIYAQRRNWQEIYVYADSEFYIYAYDNKDVKRYTYGPTGIESVGYVV